MGCDGWCRSTRSLSHLFQSTHPHGVRRTAGTGVINYRYVSIHAPAWGATQTNKCLVQNSKVSIHAPAWGATLGLLLIAISPFAFQSTHPHGVRPAAASSRAISNLSFQSTHPHGVRQINIYSNSHVLLFQSTHPHGVRPTQLGRHGPRHGFQSTHPHGVRLAPAASSLKAFWFQSTHPHGVRREESFDKEARTWFQSTHPHGVRLIRRTYKYGYYCVSIHAPAWGATINWTKLP